MKTYAPSDTNRFAVAKPITAITAGNDCDLSGKPSHILTFHIQSSNQEIIGKLLY